MTSPSLPISGGWVPISKTLVRELPKDRPFTRLEAIFSLTLDYDQGNVVTVLGYSRLWGWSRGKIERFFEELGIMIEYPSRTSQMQNQRGQIMIQMPSKKRADNGQIKFIDSKWLSNEADRKRTDASEKTSRSQSTTIDPNPKPIRKPLPEKKQPTDSRLFSDWFLYAYQITQDRPYHFEGAKDGKILAEMLSAVSCKELVAMACHFLTDPDRFPKTKAPSISFLKSKINDYPPHINGKADEYRDLGIIPPEGITLEEWQPWQK